eukprot:gene11786-24699_t
MEWLFDSNGKSIANNAKRIVADMHIQLENKNKKIIDLEKSIAQLQYLSTESLEYEIERLESRKREMLIEIERIDTTISERKAKLRESRELVRKLLRNEITITEGRTRSPSNSHRSPNSNSNSNSNNIFNESNDNSSLINESEYQNTKQYEDDNDTVGTFEDDFQEESEMISSIRELEPNLLFLLHRNSTDDIIIYTSSKSATDDEMVTCKKLTHSSYDQQIVEAISNFERMMAYGPKVLPNSERDNSDLLELPNPFVPPDSPSKTGHLVGAIELPITPNVVIDIWQAQGDLETSTSPDKGTSISTNTGRLWATTCVDGVNFAILERIYVISEVRWGLPVILQVDLFARHPVQGRLLLESIAVNT